MIPPKMFLVLCLAIGPSRFAMGQSTPAGSSPTPFGSGPRWDVQVGPNGTLDVGGARGSDVNMTGENFRGSFGASRPQGIPMNPGPSPGGMPTPSPRLFNSPSFAPNAAGTALGMNSSATERQAEASELVLPRFRADLDNGATMSNPRESWRYKYALGRWWYWQPNRSWLYWDGADWRPFSARR